MMKFIRLRDCAFGVCVEYTHSMVFRVRDDDFDRGSERRQS